MNEKTEQKNMNPDSLSHKGNIVKMMNDTTLVIENTIVEIRSTKKKCKGYILCLPGWNFSRNDVCSKSDFCSMASDSGFTLILPEMGKSIYADTDYQETRNDWKNLPTRKWVLEKMIPELQSKFKILLPGGDNFLYGISTGARGVALIAENSENIFKAGAALSGDYDQTLLKKDNLINGFYGSYEKFPERWTGNENPLNNASKIKIPLFLAHGKKDAVVPCNQTELFFKEIAAKNPALKSKIEIIENAGHDYHFWGSLNSEILLFF